MNLRLPVGLLLIATSLTPTGPLFAQATGRPIQDLPTPAYTPAPQIGPQQSPSLSAPPGSPTLPKTGPSTGDADVDELLRVRQEQERAYQELNRLNPLSEDYSPEQSQPITPAGSEPSELNRLRQLQEFLSLPVVRWFSGLIRNPAFREGANEIVNHPRREMLLYSEIALLLLTFVLRAWRLSKVKHWAKRIWTRVWVWGLFWVLALVAVPTIVLGEAYVNTVRGIVEIMSDSDLTPPAPSGTKGSEGSF